jgi:hypothetical protein
MRGRTMNTCHPQLTVQGSTRYNRRGFELRHVFGVGFRAALCLGSMIAVIPTRERRRFRHDSSWSGCPLCCRLALEKIHGGSHGNMS